MRVVALLAIVCGLLFVLGGSRGDRMSVRTISEPTLLTVVITLNDISEKYRWLSVYGCSADVYEHGTFCTGDFERESSQEVSGRKQYLFAWRNLPKGTMLIRAMAFDANSKALATGQTVVFR